MGHKRTQKQPVQFSLRAARAARDAGMEQADESAHEKWKRIVMETIREVALQSDFFTVDRVVERVQIKGAETHENRAMGPMMANARRKGWIESTRQSVQSAQKHCHAGPRTLWRSLVNGQA